MFRSEFCVQQLSWMSCKRLTENSSLHFINLFSFSRVEMSKRGGYFHQTAQEVLIGLSVLTRYNNRMYRIDEILFDKNPEATFDCQGTQVSFVDYYKKHYNIDIKDRGQPLLLHRYCTVFDLIIAFANYYCINLILGQKRRCKVKKMKHSLYVWFLSCAT